MLGGVCVCACAHSVCSFVWRAQVLVLVQVPAGPGSPGLSSELLEQLKAFTGSSLQALLVRQQLLRGQRSGKERWGQEDPPHTHTFITHDTVLALNMDTGERTQSAPPETWPRSQTPPRTQSQRPAWTRSQRPPRPWSQRPPWTWSLGQARAPNSKHQETQSFSSGGAHPQTSALRVSRFHGNPGRWSSW